MYFCLINSPPWACFNFLLPIGGWNVEREINVQHQVSFQERWVEIRTSQVFIVVRVTTGTFHPHFLSLRPDWNKETFLYCKREDQPKNCDYPQYKNVPTVPVLVTTLNYWTTPLYQQQPELGFEVRDYCSPTDDNINLRGLPFPILKGEIPL